MRMPTPVPDHLADRAFSRQEALESGISARMIDHPRFVQVHPSVYRLATTLLDRRGEIDAARLALPADAALSHTTRLELAGWSIGPPGLHFTIARDLHLDIPRISLHRTVRMPPLDERGVAMTAAWIQAGSLVSPLQLVAAGDRLAAEGQLDPSLVLDLADRDPWRPGTDAAVSVLPLIDPRSASIPESGVRVTLVGAGLERPEVNAPIMDGGEIIGFGDLVFRRWRLILEHEGRQHAESPRQFRRDIEKYQRYRELGWSYRQLTARDVGRPRQMVNDVHHALLAQGYDGPAPQFGSDWFDLFRVPSRIVPSGRCRP